MSAYPTVTAAVPPRVRNVRIVYSYLDMPDLSHGVKTVDLLCEVVSSLNLVGVERAQAMVDAHNAAGRTAVSRLCQATADAVERAIAQFVDETAYQYRDLSGRRAVVNVARLDVAPVLEACDLAPPPVIPTWFA